MCEVKKNVFLSYGHDIIPLARRIKDDLKRVHNIEAWFDENDIRSSNKWDEAIEKGILECNFFLALMTSHGFRKPNGVCLNEVVYATNHAKPLITIKLEKIPIPLLLCRIQYIDVSEIYDVKNNSFDEEAYQNLFDKIVFCINNPEIEYENQEDYILHFLNPQDNTYDLAGNLQGYYPRKWLEEDFYNFLKSNDSLYLLTGYPGTGKSTFSSYLALNAPEVKGIHFCRYDNLLSTKFSSIVKTLSFHLCSQFEEFRGEIAKLDLLNIDRSEDYLFDELFKKPLSAIKDKESETICLIVDGIDEMPLEEAAKTITNFEKAAKHFPSFLKILFTSRHNQNILKLFGEVEPHLINVTKDKCEQDVLDYLKHRYKDRKISEEEMISIAKNSDGIFQYVISVCKDIDEGRYDRNAPLPLGITKLYEYQFVTRFPNDSFNKCSSFLALVLASYEPLDIKLMKDIVGQENYDYVISKFGDYISIQGAKIRLIHKSLADFLISNKESSFNIDVSKGHQLLTEYLLKKNTIDLIENNEYYHDHALNHLLDNGNYKDIANILKERDPEVCQIFGHDIANIDIETLKKHKSFFKSLDDDEGNMMAIVAIAKSLSNRAIYSSSNFVTKIGLCLNSDLKNTLLELLDLLYAIDHSDFVKAREIGERLINNESREVKNVAYEAIGDSYRLDGNHNKAIESYKTALSFYEEDEWSTRSFMCLYNWLDLTYVKGDVNRVIDELDNIEFELPENSFNLYYVYMLYMHIYFNLGEYDKSLDYAEKQFKMACKMGSPRKKCQAYYSLAEVYNHIDTKKSDVNIAHALEIADELNSEKLYSRIGFAQVENALTKKEYEKVIELGEIAFNKLKEANYYTGCARISTSLAFANYYLGHYQKAYDNALFAINRYATIGSYPYERVRTLAILLMSAKQLNKLEEAKNIDNLNNIKFLDQYHNLNQFIEIINSI